MTRIEIEETLSRVSYRNFEFGIGRDESVHFLQLRWWDRDAGTGEPCLCKGRKWRLSAHMTRSEVVQTALMAVLAVEEHEARERFKYRGQAIFGPHFDVDALHDLSSRGALEVRRGPA